MNKNALFEALHQAGIMQDSFFHVEGDLIANYNRILEQAIGKRTALTSFHIDKRGESPEIEEELGENYLQTGPSHRYCVVVSPDQKQADLLHEEFSFDQEILDFLYQNYFSGISVATRVDGLYGEIDDDVGDYETLEDLLLIKRIHLELNTPSGFLNRARELQKYVLQLQKNPDLLLKNSSALPKKILERVKEVGDVRNYNLNPIETSKEVTTFYTRLFGGVCVFRGVELHETVQMKRPDQQPPLPKFRLGKRSLQEQLDPDALPLTQTPASHPKTVVIYQQKDEQPEDGPIVQFIPLHEQELVLRFLVEQGYADYSQYFIEPQLARLADEMLLAKGYVVTELSKEHRVHALHEHRNDMLPEWYELKEVLRKVGKGHALSEIMEGYAPTTRAMLLTSLSLEPDVANVVEHLLTRLYDYNYEKMYLHNRRHLEKLYARSDEAKQHYIVQVLGQMQHASGADI